MSNPTTTEKHTPACPRGRCVEDGLESMRLGDTYLTRLEALVRAHTIILGRYSQLLMERHIHNEIDEYQARTRPRRR